MCPGQGELTLGFAVKRSYVIGMNGTTLEKGRLVLKPTLPWFTGQRFYRVKIMRRVRVMGLC